jgi:hypothetical protein
MLSIVLKCCVGTIALVGYSDYHTLAVASRQTVVKCSTGITHIWQSYHMKKHWISLVMGILIYMSAIAGPMKGVGLSQRYDIDGVQLVQRVTL